MDIQKVFLSNAFGIFRQISANFGKFVKFMFIIRNLAERDGGKLEAGSWSQKSEIRNQEAGSWKLEAGSWKLEAGSWKQESGSWKQKTGIRKQEAGNRKLEAGNRRLEAGGWRLETRVRKLENGGFESISTGSMTTSATRVSHSCTDDYAPNFLLLWLVLSLGMDTDGLKVWRLCAAESISVPSRTSATATNIGLVKVAVLCFV